MRSGGAILTLLALISILGPELVKQSPIAQDRESSVVHGMSGTAIALGGATHVLPADKIADALVALVNQRN